MKWLFAFLLAVVIFGSAAFFGYHIIIKPEMAIRAEQRGEVPEEPRVDPSLPEFEAAAKLRQEGKLAEARSALTQFLHKYPTGKNTEAAKDLLGDVNMDILLSKYPSPEKKEYIVKSGDVLARVAARMKTTPELIMRTNNMNSTMLRIGDRLLIYNPEFSLFIQRKALSVTLLDKGNFFKRYHIKTVKLPAKTQPRITAKVAETMAWRDGKRVGFGTKEYIGSARWIRLTAPGYILYPEPEPGKPEPGGVPPPPTGLGMAASDLEELSGLVNSKTAVTITD
ncbi:MAG TPA: LysM peptidoglycan-binding domain-containing protein [Chthoniobacterales bacterium]|nr:LysM peptidoglycan-binding domain-containing protein [Chthoniobacterales bacterium]